MSVTFKKGDKIKYSLFNNVTISDVDEKYYYLTDSTNETKPIYKTLVEKYGKLINESRSE